MLTMMRETEIRDRLETTLGIRVCSEWLQACLSFLQEENEPVTTDQVLHQLLHCDLRDAVRSSSSSGGTTTTSSSSSMTQLLQQQQQSSTTTTTTTAKQELPASFQMMVQVEESVDASKNTEARLASKAAAAANHHARCLKLLLSHGYQHPPPLIVAMEVSPIPNLKNAPLAGCKLLLKGPITIRWGVWMLHSGNTNVLGGSVEELVQIQTKALEQAKQVAGVGVDHTVRALIGTAPIIDNDEPQDEAEEESRDVPLQSLLTTLVEAPPTTTTVPRNASTNTSPRDMPPPPPPTTTTTTTTAQPRRPIMTTTSRPQQQQQQQLVIPTTNHRETSSIRSTTTVMTASRPAANNPYATTTTTNNNNNNSHIRSTTTLANTTTSSSNSATTNPYQRASSSSSSNNNNNNPYHHSNSTNTNSIRTPPPSSSSSSVATTTPTTTAFRANSVPPSSTSTTTTTTSTTSAKTPTDTNTPPPLPSSSSNHMTFENLHKLLQQLLVSNREMFESYNSIPFRVKMAFKGSLHFNIEKNKDYHKNNKKQGTSKYAFVVHTTFSSPTNPSSSLLLACKFPSNLVEPFFSKSPVRFTFS